MTPRDARVFVQEARARERAGCLPEAITHYEAAIAEAERAGDERVLAEALRRLAVVRHHRGESSAARALCHRSREVAMRGGDTLLAAEALNTLGGLDLMAGALEEARANFRQALALDGANTELQARVQQNLGIVANIQGDLAEAL